MHISLYYCLNLPLSIVWFYCIFPPFCIRSLDLFYDSELYLHSFTPYDSKDFFLTSEWPTFYLSMSIWYTLHFFFFFLQLQLFNQLLTWRNRFFRVAFKRNTSAKTPRRFERLQDIMETCCCCSEQRSCVRIMAANRQQIKKKFCTVSPQKSTRVSGLMQANVD